MRFACDRFARRRGVSAVVLGNGTKGAYALEHSRWDPDPSQRGLTVAAEGRFRNRRRPLSLGGGNRSSCPIISLHLRRFRPSPDLPGAGVRGLAAETAAITCKARHPGDGGRGGADGVYPSSLRCSAA